MFKIKKIRQNIFQKSTYKTILMLMIVLMIPLPAVVYATQDISQEKTIVYEDTCVDIQVHGDGYYGLIDDVTVHFTDNQIDYLYLNEPTLLSFVVSSKYNQGVWIIDKRQGEKFIYQLSEIKEELSNDEDKKR